MSKSVQVVFGLNGCFGRMGKDTPMDLSNIAALAAATAASQHAKAGFYGLSSPTRYSATDPSLTPRGAPTRPPCDGCSHTPSAEARCRRSWVQ